MRPLAEWPPPKCRSECMSRRRRRSTLASRRRRRSSLAIPPPRRGYRRARPRRVTLCHLPFWRSLATLVASRPAPTRLRLRFSPMGGVTRRTLPFRRCPMVRSAGIAARYWRPFASTWVCRRRSTALRLGGHADPSPSRSPRLRRLRRHSGTLRRLLRRALIPSPMRFGGTSRLTWPRPMRGARRPPTRAVCACVSSMPCGRVASFSEGTTWSSSARPLPWSLSSGLKFRSRSTRATTPTRPWRSTSLGMLRSSTGTSTSPVMP